MAAFNATGRPDAHATAPLLLTDTERWAAVPGYEDLYQVSDQGRVRSLDRIVEGADGRRTTHTATMLRAFPNSVGYLRVRLSNAGAREMKFVHHLVAEAFIGPRPEGHELRHLNGNRLDNRANNLAYGTHSDNVRDAVRHGTHNMARRVACPRCHPLVAPNLVPSALRRGSRECLACARARSALWKRGVRPGDPTFKAVADAYYAALTATTAQKGRAA